MVGDVAARCVMCDAKTLVTFHRLLAKDVIGVAKTGSGKTLGYLLPGRGENLLISGISKLMWAASNIVNSLLVWKNTIIQVRV